MRKLILLTTFAVFTPVLIIISLVILSYFQFLRAHSQNNAFTGSKTHLYAALPKDQNSIEEDLKEEDIRLERVRNFFSRYKSPLKDYASNVVEAADRYGLDYRLLPAIAMQESNLCKKAPENSYNCWGFGIYGKNVKMFDNYPHAIDIVTKTLAYDYNGAGLHSVEEIASKYTPSDNGKWVKSVSFFMEKL